MEVWCGVVALAYPSIRYVSLCQRVSVGHRFPASMTTKTHIARLRETKTLHGVASLLGYSAKGFAFVVYGNRDVPKYKEFQIPKRAGGSRTIHAPFQELKTLQRRVAKLLETSITEIDTERNKRNKFSHGFRPKHSIMTNAAAHKRRRYVFNIDLSDFFGTINFGRVSGFLSKNRNFNLDPAVARIFAQIACHNKVLPQGSPCSPVLSNLIGHILDVRMAQLAAKWGCYYTRYADDMTFSTNKADFPEAIAVRLNGSNLWEPGKALLRVLKESRFSLNPAKTRMQFREFRQDVTGIVVNSKLNVRAEYARTARAMVHSLVTTGEYTMNYYRDDNGIWTRVPKKGTRAQLRGVLSFIDSVRHFESEKKVVKKDHVDYRPARVDIKEMDGAARTYRRFLQFTQFYEPDAALVICEGKTDQVYLRCALRYLSTAHPTLATMKGADLDLHIGFFNYSKIADRILHMGGGTGDMDSFIARYGKEHVGFLSKNKRKPVIVLIDNDAGANSTFSAIKKAAGSKATIDGSEPYYFICDNLYVVPIPKLDGKPTTIEHFFDKSVREKKLGAKSFSGTDKFDPKTQYGKHWFAEYVIKKEHPTIDFSKFGVILARIENVLALHAAKP